MQSNGLRFITFFKNNILHDISYHMSYDIYHVPYNMMTEMTKLLGTKYVSIWLLIVLYHKMWIVYRKILTTNACSRLKKANFEKTCGPFPDLWTNVYSTHNNTVK